MCFPVLFPDGKCDFTVPRRIKVDLDEYLKHLIQFHDQRFA